MATLVQFLAAGVKGAENGTATFLFRGGASGVEEFLYTDFERTAQPGTNVIELDANGAAEVYCSVYVDVSIRTSAGDFLHTVTVGNGDDNVEVRSTSFTGTDYDGSPANTIGEPITLAAVLDKWITSAGASNWQVLFNGVATNLQAALAGATGFFVNVKDPTYGATGDGVTDDTTAILAATTAANGGIVFFPKGTYKITTLSLSGANINWLGSGAGATIISGTTSTNLIELTDNTNTGWKNFTGLSFTSSGSYTRLFSLEENQNVTFARCTFDGTNCAANSIAGSSVDGLSKYMFTDCAFAVGLALRCFFNPADVSERHISFKGCVFTAPSGFTGSILGGPDMLVDGCTFDASAVTSGVYWAVVAGAAGRYVGSFTNCKFLDGGSAGFAFRLTDIATSCDFAETGNVFIGFTAPVSLSDPGHIYDLSVDATNFNNRFVLGGRRGASLTFTVSNSAVFPFPILANVAAETIIVNYTDAGSDNLLIGPTPDVPSGDTVVLILNNTGGPVVSLLFASSGFSENEANVPNGGKAVGFFRSFVEVAGSEQNILFSTLQSPT